MKKITTGSLLLASLLMVGAITQASAYTMLTTQLDPGAKGANVTNLQTFLKDNPSIYPEGLVTGYYGNLTKTSVQRFQAAYGLETVGRVGPATLTKINSLIANGGWVTVDSSAPVIYSVVNTTSQNSATFTWTTNENTTAKVFYSTVPVTVTEGDMNGNGFNIRSGQVAINSNNLGSSQQVTVSGLLSNTVYYYIVVATDAAGNVSVSNINSTFRTN